jgi:hypothetical protein
MSIAKLKTVYSNGAFINNVKAFFNKINEIIDYLNGNPIPEDQYQTTIVNISSSQILNMGTTPIELLPAPGENKYYDIEQIILEYTHVNSTYDNNEYFRFSSGYQSTTASEVIRQPENGAHISKTYTSSVQQSDTVEKYSNRINQSVNIQSGIDNGGFEPANPTNGDGTMRAIIKYKVRTFGE